MSVLVLHCHCLAEKNAKTGIKINPSTRFPKLARKMLKKVRKTVIITHGFRSNAKEKWVKRMELAFMAKVIFFIHNISEWPNVFYEDANVITADWEKGAKKLNYIQAVQRWQTTASMVHGYTLINEATGEFPPCDRESG